MAPQLTHAEIQELLGAYALDAVDAEEAAAVGAHLAECPRCPNEVAAHREAATLLAFTGVAAPAGLWSRIAAGLEDVPPPLELPRLGPDQTYQLWDVIGAQTISLGVLGDRPAVTPFRAAGPLTALAITAEHAGGAVAPTTAPIVQGFVATS